jgi:aquaporin Z
MIDSLQKYLAELFGTFTLVFVGSTAIVSTRTQGESGFDVTVGLAFGLALLAGLFAFAELSGGHFNPIVSIAMVLDRRLDAKDLIPYWVAQFAGAVLASLCVLIAFDQDAVAGTATRPGPQGAGTALFLELLASAIFVLVILQSTKSERHGGMAVLAIPLTLAAAHFALIPQSGSSLNTARSFGPALIGNEWSDFWVYVVGPPLGAVLGWVVYAVVSTPQPEVTKQEAESSA